MGDEGVDVFQVRIHGRGGQGVFSTAELLALAGRHEGRHAQMSLGVGVERTGAPIASSVRISDEPIRLHDPVGTPDAVIVEDVTLLRQVDVFAGLRRDGFVVVSSVRSPERLGLCPDLRHLHPDRVVTVPAREIMIRHVGRPAPGPALLAAFTAVTRVVTLDSVLWALGRRRPGPLFGTYAAAALETYELVRSETCAAGSDRVASA